MVHSEGVVVDVGSYLVNHTYLIFKKWYIFFNDNGMKCSTQIKHS